jgi:hypothetical protein
MKVLQIVRAIVFEVALIPIQVALVIVLLPVALFTGLLLYPISRSWSQAAFNATVEANDAFSRFRLRLSGDPRAATYSNLRPPRDSNSDTTAP